MALLLVHSWLVGCVSTAPPEASAALNDYEKSFIGKKYLNKSVSFDLCPAPDFPINQEGSCVIVSDKETLTVSGVVHAQNDSFFHVVLADGRSGYVMNSHFSLIDRLSKPSPRVGMREDQAAESSWGDPTQKNVTDVSGHRMEQWVFPDLGYLYIQDGRLSAIQRIEQ